MPIRSRYREVRKEVMANIDHFVSEENRWRRPEGGATVQGNRNRNGNAAPARVAGVANGRANGVVVVKETDETVELRPRVNGFPNGHGRTTVRAYAAMGEGQP